MKNILLILICFITSACFSQIKVKDLPTTTTGAGGDFLIKDDAAGTSGSTKKISVANFESTYSLTVGGITTLNAGSNITLTHSGSSYTITAGGGSGTPGGSNTQIQYNNSGSFGGITGATTNGTVLTLTAPILGTPASGTLTNCIGLPLGTGVSGTLGVINGGTNFSSYTTGDMIYATGGTALNQLAAVSTGNALISGGIATAPSWGKIGLATHVSGNLPVTNLNSGTSASSSTFWRGDGTWGTPPSGSVSLTFNDPLVNTTNTVSINDADADGITKGASTFEPLDFDASAGDISIDYLNGRSANTITKGFLTSTDWNVFNNKQSSLTFVSPLALGSGSVTIGNIPVTKLNSGTSASSSTFWRGDGTWAAPSGGGTASVTVTDNTSSTSINYPVFSSATSGAQPIFTSSTKLNFKPALGDFAFGTNEYSYIGTDVNNNFPTTLKYTYVYRKDTAGRVNIGFFNKDTSSASWNFLSIGNPYRSQWQYMINVPLNCTTGPAPPGTAIWGAGSGNYRTQIYNDNNDANGGIQLGLHYRTGLLSAIVIGDYTNEYVGIHTNNPTQQLDVNGSFACKGTRFTIDTINNRIGIGTTTPSHDIDFIKNSNSRHQLYIGNTTSGTVSTSELYLETNSHYGILSSISSANTALGVPGWAGTTTLFSTAPSGIKISETANKIIQLSTTSYDTPDFTVGALANTCPSCIGINTATATACLDIARAGTASYAPLKIASSGTTFHSTPTLGEIECGTVGLVVQNAGLVMGQKIHTALTEQYTFGSATGPTRLVIKSADDFALMAAMNNAGSYLYYAMFKSTDPTYPDMGFLNSTGTGGLSLSSNVAGGVSSINFYTNSSSVKRWTITDAGHIIAGVDNSYDIGASGATRPRTAYLGTSVIAPLLIGGIGTTQTLTYKTTTGVGASGADHVFQVGNNGATEAMRILNSGLIGIATSTPGAQLDIATTYSVGVKITQTNGGANASSLSTTATNTITANSTTGILSNVSNTGTGATSTYGIWSIPSSAGTASYNYGVLSQPSGGTNAYAFYGQAQSATNNYGIAIQSGNSGFGTITPTALVHIAAGTTGTAPLKLTSGTNLTSPQAGALEYDGITFWGTNNRTIRQEIPQITQGVVSSQFDKTNTTLADVTGLTASLGTGTYRFEAILHVTADVTGGHKYAIGGTVSASNIIYQINSINNGTNAFRINSRQTSIGGSAGEAVGTSYYTTISGTITVSVAGTLTVQFAENTGTGTSSILVGSTFVVTQIN